MEESSTQLADTRPILDHPLRVAIPVNVPARNVVPNRDSTIYSTTFSPTAINISNYQFFHNNFKEHNNIFYSQKPANNATTSDKSVSMFSELQDSSSSANNSANSNMINISEKLHINKLPIPSNDPVKLIHSFELSSHSGSDQQKSFLRYDANVKNLLNDYQLLATSSKRANKKDVEAMAYASLGVLYDNQDDYLISIPYYQKYLGLCEELQDTIGISSAYNCIGMNYMLLVNPLFEKSEIFKNYLLTLNNNHSMEFFNDYILHSPTMMKTNTATAPTTLAAATTTGHFGSTFSSANNPLANISSKYIEIVKYINLAIEAHQKHLDICPDLGGKFIANINLGICYHWMNSLQQSAFHFQDALRISIKMQTLFGQSIAVGNLGLLALNKKDFHTARTCFDQHLQLIQALMDPEAEIAAWILLSELCTAQEHYSDALDNLEEARKIAERESFLNDLRRIHCLMGIAKGTLDFGQYCNSLQYMNPIY